MLGIVYYGGKITTEADTAIKVATSAGTVVGQLGFGMIADLFGRQRIVSDLSRRRTSTPLEPPLN